MRKFQLLFVLFFTNPTIGCSTQPENLMFETNGLSQTEWQKLQDECDYEAKKATASAPINIAHYRWKDIYIRCLEAHGTKLLGPQQ
ncbi:hypothetical protein AB4072_01920 [Microvirga sp. 2MCAF38]|uniref:hypothetical protein n=1 Tax=Microvirga sp. 2MCAF38 TaxID=3232989 RepID=UPI003F98188E